MNSTLDVNIMLNADCAMVALDNSDYSQLLEGDIKNHAILEYLQDNTNTTITQRIHVITGDLDPQISTSLPIPLPVDGTYTYFRMVIPSFNHYWNEETQKYEVKNKYFSKIIYDSVAKVHREEVFYSTIDLVEFDLEKVTLVVDYQEVWNARETDNQIFWFNSKFFSICKLNNCLVKLIKHDLDNIVKNGCEFGCIKKDQKQLLQDFLLESSFALKYLIEQGRLEDAQRVLATINNCSGICSGELGNSTTDCGCGKNL